VVIINCQPKTFINDKVVRLVVTEESDLLFLQEQYENNRSLDFWIEPFRLGNIDVRVTEADFASFSEVLTKRNIAHEINIDNVQELVDQQMWRDPSEPQAFGLLKYNTLADIQTYLSDFAASHPGVARVVEVGRSYEGRPILAVVISNNPTGTNRVLWIQAGIHAREWIAPATALYMMTKSLDDPDTALTWEAIYNNAEVYWIPNLNVDGYLYSWTGDRMWRKTRRPNAGSSCFGTDANRNYELGWGGPGSSPQFCSETYRGTSFNSEREVQTTTTFLSNLPKSVVGFICLHSYSQLWLSPWGSWTESTTHAALQNSLGSQAVTAIRNGGYNTVYTYGPISTTLYIASGGSVDWAYGGLGTIYSFTPELRDTGSWGFLLPENQIEPSGIETNEAFLVWARRSLDL